MSARLSRNKNIQDKFSLKQPGIINVAGEVFFLNPPGQDLEDLTSTLLDDSMKGDKAFTVLFLGGLPKEKGGRYFTEKEQTDLHRIFRAIFGPGGRILPTKAQVATVGRRITGKPGIAMPSKRKEGFQLPCSMEDRKLMVKALNIRRNKLIEEIQNYDKLDSDDIHARYLRDHLKRLNQLLDDEIPNTRADCRPTGIIDPHAPTSLPLSDERMKRLLEIFAYLLAQGQDPTRALRTRYPDPKEVLTLMAQPDAPDIYNYEDEFVKEHPGKTPTYTETLMKIRKVLEGDVALTTAVVNQEIKNAFEQLENDVFKGRPDTSGSYEDRKKRILDKLASMEKEIADGIATKLGLDKRIADLEKQITDLKAQLAACNEKVAKFEAAASVPKADMDKLTAEKNKVEEELAVTKAELAKMTGLSKELEDLKAAKALVDDELARTKDELTALRLKCDEDLAKHTREVEDLTARIEALTKEAAEKDAMIDTLTREKATLTTEKATLTEEKARLEAGAEALRTQLTQLQADLAVAQETVTRLTAERDARADPATLAAAEETVRRLTAERDAAIAERDARADPATLTAAEETVRRLTQERDARPTAEALAAAQETVRRLTEERDARADPAALAAAEETVRRLTEERDARPTAEALAALQAEVDRLTTENDTLTAEVARLTALVANINELEAEKNRLSDGLGQIAVKLGLGEGPPDIARINESIQDLINRLEEANRARTTAETELADERATVVRLRDELTALRTNLSTKETDLATAQSLAGQKQADLTRAETDLTTARAEVESLTKQLNDIRASAEAGRVNQAARAALQAQLTAAQEQNTAAQTRVESLTAELNTLRADLNTLRDQEAEARRLKDEAENRLEQERNRASDLERDLAAAQNEAALATTRATTAEGDLATMTTRATTAEGKLVAAEAKIESLLSKINAFLTGKGVPAIPANFEEPNIDSALSALNNKFDEKPAAAPIVNENIFVCMLNILYNLFKNVYSQHGTPWTGATQGSKFVHMFQQIESAAGRAGLNDSAIGIFMTIMRNLKKTPPPKLPSPTSSALVLLFDTPEQKTTYLEQLAALKLIHTVDPIPFNDDDRSMASYILRDFIPLGKDFNRYALTSSGSITNVTGFNAKNIDISTVFLYVMSLTKKILNEKADVLAANGCDVNFSIPK